MEKLLVLKHVPYEGPGLFGKFAKDQGIQMDIVELFKPYQILDVNGYDGLIIMGGPMGVYENYPSENDELDTINKALGKIPILGVCLGSQLLAYALGAKVYPNMIDDRRVKEIGYYQVRLTKQGMSDPIFTGLPSPLKVLQWHGDAFDLPKGAKRLATSPSCRNQAFVYKRNGIAAYGLLFHVEATPEMVEDWIKNDDGWRHKDFDFNDEEVKQQARVETTLDERQCQIVFTNFVSLH